MKKTKLCSLYAYQFHVLSGFSDDIVNAVFTKDGGKSAGPFESLNVGFHVGDDSLTVKNNREIITKALKIDENRLFSTKQVHGSEIKVIVSDDLDKNPILEEDNFEAYDAMVSNVSGVNLMIQVADCQGILLYDPVNRVIGAVHAGWKGLVNEVVLKTLKVMEDRFGVKPINVLAAISPSLGGCCANFTDPYKELPENFHRFVNAENKVDFWEFSRQQLLTAGLQEYNIELARICTVCQMNRQFFSYRRDKKDTGRFAVVIGLK